MLHRTLSLAYAQGFRISLLTLAWACLGTTAPAWATYHFMQIEQVAAGIFGDPEAQFIQLRMRSNGQEQTQRSRLVAWDAAGRNPVLLIEFDHAVSSSQAGDRVLIVTQRLLDCSAGAIQPDFVLTNPVPAGYLDAGSITFESRDEDFIVWRLSWGGDHYTGPDDGALTNNSHGDFGPPVPGTLRTDLKAWQFQGHAEDTGHANADDYALTAAPATLVNNAGVEYTLSTGSCPAQEPEGTDGGDAADGNGDQNPEDNAPPDVQPSPRSPCAPGTASLGILSLALLLWITRQANISNPTIPPEVRKE